MLDPEETRMLDQASVPGADTCAGGKFGLHATRVYDLEVLLSMMM